MLRRKGGEDKSKGKGNSESESQANIPVDDVKVPEQAAVDCLCNERPDDDLGVSASRDEKLFRVGVSDGEHFALVAD